MARALQILASTLGLALACSSGQKSIQVPPPQAVKPPVDGGTQPTDPLGKGAPQGSVVTPDAPGKNPNDTTHGDAGSPSPGAGTADSGNNADLSIHLKAPDASSDSPTAGGGSATYASIQPLVQTFCVACHGASAKHALVTESDWQTEGKAALINWLSGGGSQPMPPSNNMPAADKLSLITYANTLN